MGRHRGLDILCNNGQLVVVGALKRTSLEVCIGEVGPDAPELGGSSSDKDHRFHAGHSLMDGDAKHLSQKTP